MIFVLFTLLLSDKQLRTIISSSACTSLKGTILLLTRSHRLASWWITFLRTRKPGDPFPFWNVRFPLRAGCTRSVRLQQQQDPSRKCHIQQVRFRHGGAVMIYEQNSFDHQMNKTAFREMVDIVPMTRSERNAFRIWVNTGKDLSSNP